LSGHELVDVVVVQKLTKAMADRDGGLVFEDGGLTVGAYVEKWIKDSVRGTVRQSTYETYEYMTYPHIVPALGRVKLKALDQAVSDGLIPRNAAKGIRLPQGKKKEIRPLSPDEARTLGLCLRRPSRGAFRAGGFHRPARGRASGPQVGGPGSGCASAIAP
jgi:hypothetical protein